MLATGVHISYSFTNDSPVIYHLATSVHVLRILANICEKYAAKYDAILLERKAN